MKKLFTFLFAVSFVAFSFGQAIPNYEFETWSGGKPTSWDAPNLNLGLTNIITVSEETSNVHSGSKSVKIETKTSMLGTIPGFITLGVFDLGTQSVTGGIPFPHRPDKLKGYYRSQPATNDQSFFGIGLSKIVGGNRDTIGQGVLLIPTAAATWTPFEVDITWDTPDVPDSLNIIISSSNLTGTSVVGSLLWVDSIYFEFTPVGMENNSNIPFTVSNCYPNPASDISNINFVAPEKSIYNFRIFNLIGVEVFSEKINANFGVNFHSFSTASLPAGIYMVNLSNGINNQTKSLVVK